MDLAAIQARLQTLGVSLQFKDDPTAIAATLRLQRQYRASLYVDRLEAVHQHLTVALAAPVAAGGLGPDYPFVAPALGSSALLNDLARSIDEWICAGVQHAMNTALAAGGVVPPTDVGWFDSRVFDPVLATYNANVNAFWAAYPITQNAVTQITANFQANVSEAAERIIGDRTRITRLFADKYTGLSLRSLRGLRSTGSDFHKGGKQVLLLEFEIAEWGGLWPVSSTLRLVYKPADLEVDCLLYGNAAAVNRALGGAPFMASSLVELCNAHIAANPAPGIEEMPTYRVLPRNVTSGGAPPVPLAAAYGYIEFLGHQTDKGWGGYTWQGLNYYPLGTSDFLIFESELSGPVIEPFYHRAGQLLALASTFALTDLHIENVRVTRYSPHLIDLEASLTKTIADVRETLLLQVPNPDEFGGFSGADRSNEDYVYHCVPDPNLANQYLMDQVFITKWYQNRLWVRRGAKQLVDMNVFWLLEGLQNGLSVISQLVAAGVPGGYPAWRARINNVLVRILPVATSAWNSVRQTIYFNEVLAGGAGVPVALAPTVAFAAAERTTLLYGQWNPAAPPPLPDPRFVAADAPQVITDLTNFDIPTFYHQIGSTELLDSTGAIIPVPANVTVLAGVPPVAGPAPSNVGRPDYFAAIPTTTYVDPQVAALGGMGLAGVTAARQNQVLNVRGLLAPPLNPGVMP